MTVTLNLYTDYWTRCTQKLFAPVENSALYYSPNKQNGMVFGECFTWNIRSLLAKKSERNAKLPLFASSTNGFLITNGSWVECVERVWQTASNVDALTWLCVCMDKIKSRESGRTLNEVHVRFEQVLRRLLKTGYTEHIFHYRVTQKQVHSMSGRFYAYLNLYRLCWSTTIIRLTIKHTRTSFDIRPL